MAASMRCTAALSGTSGHCLTAPSRNRGSRQIINCQARGGGKARYGENPGEVVSSTGTGTFTPGTPGFLGAPITAFSATSETGDTVVTWDPQITIQIPTAAVNGTYTGTITHSVA